MTANADRYDINMTGLSLADINIVYHALCNYDCDFGAAVDVIDKLDDAAFGVGLMHAITGDFVPLVDLCGNCGAYTADESYRPTADCDSADMGDCGYWRAQDAAMRAPARPAGPRCG